MQLVHGIWMPDPTPDIAQPVAIKDIKPDGTYEGEKYLNCMAQCAQRRTAVDVGAHVGTWSRLLAKDFEYVIAFEPYPDFVRCFRKNVVATNVQLRERAVGDRAGPAKLTIGPHAPPRIGEHGINVYETALDLEDLKNVDFIKMDVEGYELAVLRGAREILQRDHPVVRLEQHPKVNPMHYGFGWLEAVKFLQGLGAKLVWNDGVDYCLAWPD